MDLEVAALDLFVLFPMSQINIEQASFLWFSQVILLLIGLEDGWWGC